MFAHLQYKVCPGREIDGFDIKSPKLLGIQLWDRNRWWRTYMIYFDVVFSLSCRLTERCSLNCDQHILKLFNMAGSDATCTWRGLSWQRIGKVHDLSMAHCRRLHAEMGRPHDLVLVHTKGGSFHAMENSCSHAGKQFTYMGLRKTGLETYISGYKKTHSYSLQF